MANLKRNMIELIKNPEEVMNGGEVELQKYWTPAFIPFSKVRDAISLQTELDEGELTELDMMDKLADFIANDIYGKQFTKDDLYNRLHAPDAIDSMQQQVMFVAQGNQSEATKNFLAKKG
ncbi:hypothetical protein MST22_15475 [Virgibacillus halodenitrificans]|uniref:phage tail assembly chaperone G n=1 Tax=Virgibacillus halodenitrificans TaxID=1482 RepID=UPI001FB3163E|nr:hypothetical protein [Virgibacillus halodenitrificans]MCJ0932547.1 hypothetical protein [Virgibacillus halodenitrificans]